MPLCLQALLQLGKGVTVYAFSEFEGGGGGELCRHAQFSSFPPAVTLNAVERLTDERLSCFYVVVRALRNHYRMKHMRSNDDGHPDFLVNICADIDIGTCR